MSVLYLVLKDGDPSKVVAHACGVCRVVCHRMAEEHCAAKLCACGAVIERKYYLACDACRARADLEKEAGRFASATKVSFAEWSGTLLYCEQTERYYRDLDEFFCDFEDRDEEDVPRYLWDCDPIDLAMDARDIVANAICDNFHADAADNIDDGDYAELQKAMTAFCETVNPAGVRSWEPSRKRAVTIDAEVVEFLRELRGKDGYARDVGGEGG